jgi:fatty-acyl-CoA synthase
MVCYYRLDPSDQPLDEEGWLHTGDLGLIDDDGYLRLVGRAKELIIRGGENIAPGEIAEAMTQYPGVADVKVQGIPDDFYGEIVGASVVMKDGKTLDTEDMKKFLVSKLAKYKIPEYIFQYDKLPLLSNGKVDAVGLKKDMNAKAAALRTK